MCTINLDEKLCFDRGITDKKFLIIGLYPLYYSLHQLKLYASSVLLNNIDTYKVRK